VRIFCSREASPIGDARPSRRGPSFSSVVKVFLKFILTRTTHPVGPGPVRVPVRKSARPDDLRPRLDVDGIVEASADVKWRLPFLPQIEPAFRSALEASARRHASNTLKHQSREPRKYPMHAGGKSDGVTRSSRQPQRRDATGGVPAVLKRSEPPLVSAICRQARGRCRCLRVSW